MVFRIKKLPCIDRVKSRFKRTWGQLRLPLPYPIAYLLIIADSVKGKNFTEPTDREAAEEINVEHAGAKECV